MEDVERLTTAWKQDVDQIRRQSRGAIAEELNPVIAINGVVEICSYIFDTSAIGQEPRCREAQGGARATIHGGRIQIFAWSKNLSNYGF